MSEASHGQAVGKIVQCDIKKGEGTFDAKTKENRKFMVVMKSNGSKLYKARKKRKRKPLVGYSFTTNKV